MKNEDKLSASEKALAAIALLWVLAIGLFFAQFVCGCQSPRTSYTNGVIVWCSTSAIGIGWGEYVEVPAGGSLVRVTTNVCANLIGDGETVSVMRLSIDNSSVTTNRLEKSDE